MPPQDSFAEKLAWVQDSVDSLLCVGLDPDPSRLPRQLTETLGLEDAVSRFCLDIIDATLPFASAYKVNFAFFEALGRNGWNAIQTVSDYIPDTRIKIADAKRGDIGNTGQFYARAVFEQMDFDACTVSPYMGKSSVTPFLQYPGKAAFVLARTSNPDAAAIQLWPSDRQPLYLHVARQAKSWSRDLLGHLGLVVGATDTVALTALRSEFPRIPFLVPGVGAQGGQLSGVVRSGLDNDGSLLINSSRGIIYASEDVDFAEKAAHSASALNAEINRYRPASRES